jgi:hypothetical protein
MRFELKNNAPAPESGWEKGSLTEEAQARRLDPAAA